MLKFHRWVAVAVGLVFAWNSGLDAAQLTRGFISGTLTDPSQAVLSGVQVNITNKATNISHETRSTDAGFYRFAAVEPGTYLVEFRLPGFQSQRVDDVKVSTAQEVTLNQTLMVGGTTTDILVTQSPGVELAKTSPTIER